MTNMCMERGVFSHTILWLGLLCCLVVLAGSRDVAAETFCWNFVWPRDSVVVAKSCLMPSPKNVKVPYIAEGVEKKLPFVPRAPGISPGPSRRAPDRSPTPCSPH
jgi:hypothetical protein